MKKTLRTLMMGMMVLMGSTALTSCTNDDEPQVAQQEGQKGYVEFTLSRGADTRTAYAANKDGGLDVTWSEGDKMLVFYNDKENETVIVEQFVLVSGAGTTKATFAKSGSQLKEKSGTVLIEYLPGIDETNYQTKFFDFSEQSGSLENMADYDMFSYSATLTNGQITASEFKAAKAVYHFKANDINFGAGDGNKDFVFSEGTNAVNMIVNQEGPITVKGVSLTGGKLDKDLYVVVYASDAPTTLTVGSKTFELPTDELEAGKVYTFAQEHLTGIKVGMVIGSDGKYYATASDVPSGVTAEAMIAYLGKKDGVCENGLAIALQDVGTSYYSWDNSCKDNNDMTAAGLVAGWANSHAVTGGTWRLPSTDDWKYMFEGCGGDAYDVGLESGKEFNCGSFHDYLTNAGGTDV